MDDPGYTLIAALSLSLSLVVAGCRGSSKYSAEDFPSDPYLELIDHFDVPKGFPVSFRDTFRTEYLKRVDEGIAWSGFDPGSPRDVAEVQSHRGLTYFNLWSDWGFESIPQFAMTKHGETTCRKQVIDLNFLNKLQEIEILSLKSRIEVLKANLEAEKQKSK